MVKTGGKSSRRFDRRRSRAKPHAEQGQIGRWVARPFEFRVDRNEVASDSYPR